MLAWPVERPDVARVAFALVKWDRGSGERLPQVVARSYCRLWENIMKAIKNALVNVIKDEQGGEVLEYALIAGLIVVAAIAVIGEVGTKVLARWTSLNSSM